MGQESGKKHSSLVLLISVMRMLSFLNMSDEIRTVTLLFSFHTLVHCFVPITLGASGLEPCYSTYVTCHESSGELIKMQILIW